MVRATLGGLVGNTIGSLATVPGVGGKVVVVVEVLVDVDVDVEVLVEVLVEVELVVVLEVGVGAEMTNGVATLVRTGTGWSVTKVREKTSTALAVVR